MALAAIALLYFYIQGAGGSQIDQLPYSSFMTTVDQGEIRSVTIEGQNVVAERTAGGKVATYVPRGADLIARL